MSLFLLLQQCPTCLVLCMVLELGGKWPYSCCFVECCFQDLFNIAHSILVQFLSSFSSVHFVSIYEVHPYSFCLVNKKSEGCTFMCVNSRKGKPNDGKFS